MKVAHQQASELDAKLIQLLEKQKRELVVRVLRKQEEIQAVKNFTDKIIASFSELFFVLAEDFQIVKANKEFCLYLDYPEKDVASLHLDQIVSGETSQTIKKMIEFGEFKNFQTRLITSAGKEIHVSLNGSTLITESGRILHMIIAADKSEVYKMMSRIREVQEQLIHSGRLASLGEMAAGIGHELTQPLNAILLFARNCLKVLDGPERDPALIEENLNIIIDRVNKASSIIKSLKSFASKAGQEANPVDINCVMTTILKFLDSQLKLSDIELDLTLTPEAPVVLGQEVRLEQVLLNIIQNAVQAMGNCDSPKLTIKTYLCSGIDQESLLEKEYVVISIRDAGHGIPPEIKDHIFDPFFTTREVGLGMGLGLSIVDRIVRGLSGYIKVDSTPGEGSCFSVYLPQYLEALNGAAPR